MDQSRIAQAFADRFRNWNIELPQADLESRNAGAIQAAGWTIQYCFGADDSGEFLDYYASHRMTEDTHERLYANGSSQPLPTIHGMYLTSDDPAEAARLEKAHIETNREAAEILQAKGFQLDLNAALRAGLIR